MELHKASTTITNPLASVKSIGAQGGRVPYHFSRATSDKGFSLIEIVLIISLISFLGGITLFVGLDSYQAHLFHSDRDLVVTALQRARSQSVGNVCLGAGCTNGKPHGVAITPSDHPGKLVIFQTDSTTPDYAHRDASQDAFIEVNPGTTFSGLDVVVFSTLSGDALTPGTLTVTAQNRVSVITIGAMGQIFWSN